MSDCKLSAVLLSANTSNQTAAGVPSDLQSLSALIHMWGNEISQGLGNMEYHQASPAAGRYQEEKSVNTKTRFHPQSYSIFTYKVRTEIKMNELKLTLMPCSLA